MSPADPQVSNEPDGRRRPAPVIGFRRERKQNGEQHLVAVTVEDVVLPKGSRLLLRRLHDGGGPGPEFALVTIPAQKSLTKEQHAAAVADDLTGSAHRPDPRDEPQPQNATRPAGWNRRGAGVSQDE